MDAAYEGFIVPTPDCIAREYKRPVPITKDLGHGQIRQLKSLSPSLLPPSCLSADVLKHLSELKAQELRRYYGSCAKRPEEHLFLVIELKVDEDGGSCPPDLRFAKFVRDMLRHRLRGHDQLERVIAKPTIIAATGRSALIVRLSEVEIVISSLRSLRAKVAFEAEYGARVADIDKIENRTQWTRWDVARWSSYVERELVYFGCRRADEG